LDWRDDPAYAEDSIPNVDFRKIELASKLLGVLVKDPFATAGDKELVTRWLRSEQDGSDSVFQAHKLELQELCYAFEVLTRKGPKVEPADEVVAGQAVVELVKDVFRGEIKSDRSGVF